VTTAYSETYRQIIHIAMGGFALLLRYLTWPQAAALAAAALLFNLYLLRHLAPRILRPTDVLGLRAGVLFYPLAILAAVLVFPTRLDIVAAVWGVLAFGDGFATLAGEWLRGPRLPWNPQKTWAGLVAFIAFGASGAVALSLWVSPAVVPRPSITYSLYAPIVAAVLAAFVETLPIEVDDNISVTATTAGVMWFLAELHWIGHVDELKFDLLTGAIISAPPAFIAWRTRSLTLAGAITGALFATVTYAALYLAGLGVLGLAMLLTIASTRLGRLNRGTLNAHDAVSVRGFGNVVANCLVGTLGAVLELFSSTWGLQLTAAWFVAGIASGASDTVASEVGKAIRATCWSFPTLKPVTPGTPGAVSVAGTVAGAIAAALIALPAIALWLIPWSLLGVIVVACTIGSLLESALATAFEASRVLNNHTLNFLNTATAVGVAVFWSRGEKPPPR
jgi:uncharacterized protein (TIGR00297 family)